MVINNSADTYDIYVNTGAAGATGADLKADDFVTRDQSNTDIQTFLFRMGQGMDLGRTVYYDDIYIDTAGENLSNPIPEPASLALMGLGGLLMLSRTRRAS